MPESNEPRLFLIDAMGFIFRAFFAPMDRLRSPQGLPTKVPYLFANMVQKILREWKPEYIAVVYDRSEPTFRDKIFASYKAQRPPMPEDLSIQLPFVRRYCEAMRLPILELPGYEADDIIGTLAQRSAAENLDVIIVTSDKDLLQLVGGRVRALIPTKGNLLADEKKVEELMGVPPARIPDLLALMGDTIDNIPGARDPGDKPAPGERRKAGIGEVGARQLIQQYGTAEECILHAAEIKRANYREALEKNARFVHLSKQLATIPTDAPIEADLPSLRRRSPDSDALRELYTELGFTSLLRDLSPAAPAISADYQPLASPAALAKYLKNLPSSQPVALWLEPEDDEDPGFGSRASRLEISAAPGLARFTALDPKSSELAPLRTWLASAKPPKIVHDPKLLALLAASDEPDSPLAIEGVLHATMLYSFLLRPTTSNHALSELALRHLGATLSGAPGERADFLARIAPLLRAEVESQGLLEVYEKIDLPLAPVLAEIERSGVLVDGAALARFSADIEKDLRSLERRIFDLSGHEFNINSPQQLAEVLFDKLELPPPRRVRAKPRSTSADVLEELAGIHQMPRLVMEFRELAKLKSTYADALPKLIHPVTGRLHTRLSQTGAATGRLASSSPNLQNIPVRTELGREIRAAFVAEEGRVLLSADYSQIELRLLAHFSQDPVLLQAFHRGEDIHSRTAQEVFGVTPALQTSEHRRAAKVINFGIIYGLSAFGLAQQLDTSQKEAAKFIDAYFQRYRGVREYLDRQVAETRALGFTRTLYGRIRPIPEINAPQPAMRNFAERTAMNTPLQGTAADIIKLAMICIHRELAASKLRARMILQVHDELLFEVVPKEIKKLVAIVKPAMERVESFSGPLHVPITIEMKSGPNWRDMAPLA